MKEKERKKRKRKLMDRRGRGPVGLIPQNLEKMAWPADARCGARPGLPWREGKEGQEGLCSAPRV
jgi:hypothetical protein